MEVSERAIRLREVCLCLAVNPSATSPRCVATVSVFLTYLNDISLLFSRPILIFGRTSDEEDEMRADENLKAVYRTMPPLPRVEHIPFLEDSPPTLLGKRVSQWWQTLSTAYDCLRRLVPRKCLS